jgi:hypothetical protein
MALSFSDAKAIQIIDYLSQIGFEPAKIRGNDHWYHSPFRHERTPSFKVNTKLNVWYDHGSGEGGTIVDLGSKLHQCSLTEFLDKLSASNYSTVPRQKPAFEPPENKLEIISAKELSNCDLIHYVESRKILPHFAREFCKEIEFTIAKKPYKAVGFQNRSGGYELRNRWFKGSSSPKDVSIIDNGSTNLCVMEGFMDFLSALTLNQKRLIELPLKSNFLILNSLSFLQKNISLLQRHEQNLFFLDNDLAGKEAMQMLTTNVISVKDASTLYKPFKDVNEYLVDHSKQNVTLSRPKGVKL